MRVADGILNVCAVRRGGGRIGQDGLLPRVEQDAQSAGVLFGVVPEVVPQLVAPEGPLRVLLTGWQEVVFITPTATDDYRALTQQVILDAEASFKSGATPYQAVIFALAPVFAGVDEETLSAIAWPDDADEAATVQRAVQTGEKNFQAHGYGGRVSAPVHVEIGDTPGDLPETPPEHREAAHQTLELLLGGWTEAVGKTDVSDRYRRVVAETVKRVRDAAEYNTTPHNLVSTLLAIAFLLPDEPEPTSIMSADLEALGAVLHWGNHTERLYPSVLDDL